MAGIDQWQVDLEWEPCTEGGRWGLAETPEPVEGKRRAPRKFAGEMVTGATLDRRLRGVGSKAPKKTAIAVATPSSRSSEKQAEKASEAKGWMPDRATHLVSVTERDCADFILAQINSRQRRALVCDEWDFGTVRAVALALVEGGAAMPFLAVSSQGREEFWRQELLTVWRVPQELVDVRVMSFAALVQKQKQQKEREEKAVVVVDAFEWPKKPAVSRDLLRALESIHCPCLLLLSTKEVLLQQEETTGKEATEEKTKVRTKAKGKGGKGGKGGKAKRKKQPHPALVLLRSPDDSCYSGGVVDLTLLQKEGTAMMRSFDSVLRRLAMVQRRVEMVKLTGEEKEWYRNLMMATPEAKRLSSSLEHGLKTVCMHPHLLLGPAGTHNPTFSIAVSSKLQALDQMLPALLAKPGAGKLLLLSSRREMIDILEDFLAFRLFPLLRIDGSSLPHQRAVDSARFLLDPSVRILLSTSASILQSPVSCLADVTTVICYDPNAEVVHHPKFRALLHSSEGRISLDIIYLCAQHTIEEYILDRRGISQSLASPPVPIVPVATAFSDAAAISSSIQEASFIKSMLRNGAYSVIE